MDHAPATADPAPTAVGPAPAAADSAEGERGTEEPLAAAHRAALCVRRFVSHFYGGHRGARCMYVARAPWPQHRFGVLPWVQPHPVPWGVARGAFWWPRGPAERVAYQPPGPYAGVQFFTPAVGVVPAGLELAGAMAGVQLDSGRSARGPRELDDTPVRPAAEARLARDGGPAPSCRRTLQF